MADLMDLFLDSGLVTSRDLDQAMLVRQQVGGSLEAALVRLGAVAERDLLQLLSQVSHIPVIEAAALPPRSAVRDAIERLKVPAPWLMERQAAPWFEGKEGDERLFIACSIIPGSELQEAAEQWHEGPTFFRLAGGQAVEQLLDGLAESEADDVDLLGADRLRELAEEAPAIDFVNAMFAEAILRRASDIHVEPFEDRFVVRLRVDGVLAEWRTASRASFDAVASRIKLLSLMDIAERRLPQDGRQSIRISGQEVDVRVSALPTSWGESIVLRFLGNRTTLPSLGELGLSGEDSETLLDLIRQPNGILLVTGPTGSGKTTTVYRLLSHLNDGSRKIVTVEDPVEMDLPGILQTAVRGDIGLNFATGLRSILRQDPDVILVGEIRDSETARIAVQAALTGHLVISTVHTNSAPAAITRLLDLGVESFLLAEVVRGLVGQRLLRRICDRCGQATPDPDADDYVRRHVSKRFVTGPGKWRRTTGCPACGGTGYSGRVGAFELLPVDPALQRAIRAREDEAAIIHLARERGFRSMEEDGLLKARNGTTSIAEALRVLASHGGGAG